MPNTGLSYRGRFAPTPSGPLHFGSLVCALASYLDAKSQQGSWLLRIDDLDAARVAPGAISLILQVLEVHGLNWDESIYYQSQQSAAYAAAFTQLQASGLVYPCACSRREIADSRVAEDKAGIYPGHCRHGYAEDKALRGWRVYTQRTAVQFSDRLQGVWSQSLAQDVGDFILRRADGSFAYQLAAVVDDAAMQISDVVRGADLLDSSSRQIYLQQLLGLPQPRYLHLPVVVNALGEKLSKQTLAPPLDLKTPQANLLQALRFLGLNPPADAAANQVSELLDWGRKHWNLAQLPRKLSIALT